MHCWLVHHPPADTHPGAVLLFTDPTHQPTPTDTAPIAIPCWILDCRCNDDYEPRNATLGDAIAALADITPDPSSGRQNAPGATNTSPRGGTDPANGTEAHSAVSARINGGSCIDGELAHPGDVPLPLWPDVPGQGSR